MNETEFYSKNICIDNLKEIKEIEYCKGHLSLDLKEDKHFVLLVIESNSIDSIENKYLTIIARFYSQLNYSSSIDIYSYQLYYLYENQFQLFYLYQIPLIEYRILINNREGEGNICFSINYDDNNNFIHLKE